MSQGTETTDPKLAASPPPASLEDELKALRKENRKLKRELESTQTVLKTTNDLYVTSERVLTKAYQDLKEAADRSRELQAELDRAAKLAVVGELAARVVHEVLNPMTSLLGRLQSMILRHEPQPRSDPMGVLTEILTDWRKLTSPEALQKHMTTPGESGSSLFAEDLGDCEVLLKALQDSQRTLIDDLRFLERTCLHTVKIVNNMRTLARNRVELAQVNLNDLLVDTVELQRDQLRRSAVAVHERYMPDLPLVYADSNEMIQVFTNILRNAQQAIGRGGSIELATSATPERVEIRFTDDGPGITGTHGQINRVFEGGFTTKPVGEGSGLGLAICRRFLRKYHGDVEVEWTRPGQGTCFLVWLPRSLNLALVEAELVHDGH